MGRLNILFLTYCYPPQQFPRSVQISHLVQYLRKNFNITVVTSKPESEGDSSLLSFTPLDNVIYAPKSTLSRAVERVRGDRIKNKILPDYQYLWHFDLFHKTQELIEKAKPDIIVTFGQPMSTHITGLKLKKRYPNIQWVAHFSDPWVDNIYNNYNFWTQWINQYYQDIVFQKADRLIFTSSDTVDLVTKKYSLTVRVKSFTLPHAYNQELYTFKNNTKNEKILVRYIGNFYGDRQPDCFLKALSMLNNVARSKFIVELIGSSTTSLQEKIQFYKLEDTVFAFSAVSYVKSLELMHSSDLLLIIDAPTEQSPFLPSKLIEYIGANKPIFGITPPGSAQKLIEDIGFTVVDPQNITDICNEFEQVIANFSQYNMIKSSFIKERYSILTVGKQIESWFLN